MAKLDSYWENGKNSNLNPKFGWQGNRFPIRRGVTIRMNNKNHSYRDSNIRLIIVTIYFVTIVDSSTYAIVVALAILTGWVSVYVIGGWAMLFRKTYDPSLMQRVFHYSMLVMLWAINERASSA